MKSENSLNISKRKMSTDGDNNKNNSDRRRPSEIWKEAESRRKDLDELVYKCKTEQLGACNKGHVPPLPSGFAEYCCADPGCPQTICVQIRNIRSSHQLATEALKKELAANRLLSSAVALVAEEEEMRFVTEDAESHCNFRMAASLMRCIVNLVERHPDSGRKATLRAIHEEFKTCETQQDVYQLQLEICDRLRDVRHFDHPRCRYHLDTIGLLMTSFGTCKPLSNFDFRATMLRKMAEENTRVPLQLVKSLGAGTFSHVFQFDGTTFVKISSGKCEPCYTGGDAEHLQQELDVLKQLDHPAIPRPLCQELESIELEFENYPKIDRKCLRLEGIIEDAPPQWYDHETPRKVRSCLQSIVDQMLSALKHAHSRNIVHLDVKRNNIVVADLKDGVCRAQLIDWGCAEEAGKEKRVFVGSPWFAHEELFNVEKEKRTWITDSKHDHASLGFTVAYMLGSRLCIFPSGKEKEKKQMASRCDECVRVIQECPPELLNQATRDLLTDYIRPSPKVLPIYDGPCKRTRSKPSMMPSSQLAVSHRTRGRKRKSNTP